MGSRLYSIVIDSHDPAKLARFWAAALDYEIAFESDDEVAVEPRGEAKEPALVFLPVPEAKSVKNRLHIDLAPDDQGAYVERLKGLGAAVADIGQGDVSWVVIRDPEGNEFCVQPAYPPHVRTEWLRRYEAYQPARS